MVRQCRISGKSLFFLPIITACGFVSTTGQIIILREFLVLFYGNELTIGLIFAAWLLWTALGSTVGGRCGVRLACHANLLPGVLVLLGLLLPVSVLWIRATRIIWAVPTGEMIGPFAMVGIVFVGTGLFCLTSGALFGLSWTGLAAVSGQKSEQPLLIYLGEAMGAAMGGLAFYFILLPHVGVFHAVLLIALLVLMLAGVLQGWQGGLSFRYPAALGWVLLGSALVAGALVHSGELDRQSRQWQWGAGLLAVRDTPYQNLALLADSNQFSLFANGLLLFSVPDPQSSEYAVHLAMLQHRMPRQVLLIGGGVAGLLPEILKHPGVRRVDYVEPDPEVIEMAEEFLPGSATAALMDRRVLLFHADAGSFVRTAASRYDVIIMHLGDPVNAEMNRFYTVECFTRLARILAHDGILSFAISSSPDMVGPTQARLLRSVAATLRSVFAGVLVIPGENARYCASHRLENLTADPAVLIQRLTERGLDLHFVREYYLFDYLNPLRLRYLQSLLDQPSPMALNRDFEPTCYFNGLAVSAGQIHPRLGEALLALAGVGRLPFWTTVGALSVGMVLLGRRGCRRGSRVIGLNVLIVGGSGMVLEMILLLAFQILEGFLYRQLALIIAVFMGGMSLGTGIFALLAERVTRPWKWFVLVQTLFTLFLLGILALLHILHQDLQASPPVIRPLNAIFPLLAFAAGILSGGHFTLGVRSFSKLPGYSAATGPGLYALDLLGATGGILVASLFVLPLYGLPATMLALAIFCFAGTLSMLGK